MRLVVIAMLFAAAPLAACNSTVSTGTTGATSTAGTGGTTGVGGGSTTSGNSGATGTGGIEINPIPKDSFPCGNDVCLNGDLCLIKSSGPPPTPPPGPGGAPCQPMPEVCSGAMGTCACLLQHCPCGDPTLACDLTVPITTCSQDSEGNIEFTCTYP